MEDVRKKLGADATDADSKSRSRCTDRDSEKKNC